MPSTLRWLMVIVRIAVAPVLTGALAVLAHSTLHASDIAAATGLLALAIIHVAYWWDPWRRTQAQTIRAAIGMAGVNFVLLNIPGFSEPLVWLYPALVAGAGLRTPAAVLGIGLTALAAAAPLAQAGGSSIRPTRGIHPRHSGRVIQYCCQSCWRDWECMPCGSSSR
jgi:hypothetical protein